MPVRNSSAPIRLDADDHSRLDGKTLRLISGRILTTYRNPAGYEVGIPVGNLLLGLSPFAQVVPADGDLYNLTRANLQIGKGQPQNKIIFRGLDALLLLGDGGAIFIDTDEAERISLEQWHLRHGLPTQIVAYTGPENERTKLLLPRYVLRLDTNDPRLVRFKDSDVMNCRKANLYLTKRKAKD